MSQPGDQYEQEAERVADEIMRAPMRERMETAGVAAHAKENGAQAGNRSPETNSPSIAKNVASERTAQTSQMDSQPVSAEPGTGAPAVPASSGQPLSASLRTFFEPRFGTDFSRVRVHTDTQAEDAAESISARAFTIGRDIFLGSAQYDPSSVAGRRLLAHELTHVVQQQGVNTAPAREPLTAGNRSRTNVTNLSSGSPVVSPSYYPRIRSAGAGPRQIMRQPQPQTAQSRATPAATQAAAPPTATEFLRELTQFVRTLMQFVQTLRQIAAAPAIPPTRRQQRQQRRQARQAPAPQPPLQRAHTVLNQKRLQDLIRSASTTYERENSTLPVNDPQRTQLREAFVQALDEIRIASDVSLDLSNQMDASIRDPEQQAYAETMAQLIEASPMTSAGLTRTTTFQQADITAGTSYEAALEHYLDDLLTRLPTLTLTTAQKDQIYERIQVALRRAFVTVAAGPAGTIDVSAITNQQIANKYRMVAALLASGVSNPQQMSIITEAIPTYQLPNPVPNVSSQITGRTVDLSRVPPDEVDSVRYGILQAVNSVPSAGSTVQLQNAYWPVALQILRGGIIVSIRYELVFDSAGNVRAERLGEARAREVAPAFAQLSVAAKKTQLIADFGLAAVDDRPAAPGRARTRTRAAVAPRPVRNWSAAELDQVKGAFDLIPQADRAALSGVTLVRDHQGPAPTGASVLTGFHHTGADPVHDDPGPPTHGPPHIHYYDEAFNQNAVTAVGAPGATGPGADETLLHEVGHARIALAGRTADAARIVANQQATQARMRGIRVTTAQRPAWNAWNAAQGTANAAIVAFHNSLISSPPASAAQQATLLTAAMTAVAARDAARPGLAAAGLGQNVVDGAAALDAANDAMLAASQQLAASQDQVPIFVSLATGFGFHRFTDYARRGATDEEWFAETYSLWLTDPNRLSQMNRSIFLWFQAGMPMDRTWTP